MFGSKNLKAVAIRGTGSVKVGDARAFLADIARIHNEHVLTDFNLWANEEGTPILVDPVNGAGALPTRNWSAGSFEGAAGINSEAFQKVKVANRACYQCALGCRQVHEAGGVKGEGPEYETIALCGVQLRGRRHRSADALQPRVRRMGPGHHLLRLGGGAGHGHDRAGASPTSDSASARPTATWPRRP